MDKKIKVNMYLTLARMTIVAFEDIQGLLREQYVNELKESGVTNPFEIQKELDAYQLDLDAYICEMRHNIDSFVVNEEKIMTDFIDGFHGYLKNRAIYYLEKELPKLKTKE